MPFPSDLEIARKAALRPLADIANESGIPENSLEIYGEGAAKIKPLLSMPTITSIFLSLNAS